MAFGLLPLAVVLHQLQGCFVDVVSVLACGGLDLGACWYSQSSFFSKPATSDILEVLIMLCALFKMTLKMRLGIDPLISIAVPQLR
ncbi:hypothetical protein BRADI_3g27071v3 [Brachypodium distachyon]|uniref:Uncharacterized protein n=1 Tax=Brachypodium distachyon TaxID=15368 RepID=A0A2K2CZF2_BRADI|nr:hypothetical protein BRADI_3g27071v3 [Brachypodium distachyon]